MKTSPQVRNEIYTALSSDTAVKTLLGNPVRLFSLGSIAKQSTFPVATFSKLDNEGLYAFGVDMQAEDVTFELRFYTDVQDTDSNGSKQDKLLEAVKPVMHTLGYELVGMSPEFLEESLHKIVSATRWSTINA